MRKLAEGFEPDVYMDVHSGNIAIVHPFGFETEKIDNLEDVTKIVNHTAENYKPSYYTNLVKTGSYKNILYGSRGLGIDWNVQ